VSTTPIPSALASLTEVGAQFATAPLEPSHCGTSNSVRPWPLALSGSGRPGAQLAAGGNSRYGELTRCWLVLSRVCRTSAGRASAAASRLVWSCSVLVAPMRVVATAGWCRVQASAIWAELHPRVVAASRTVLPSLGRCECAGRDSPRRQRAGRRRCAAPPQRVSTVGGYLPVRNRWPAGPRHQAHPAVLGGGDVFDLGGAFEKGVLQLQRHRRRPAMPIGQHAGGDGVPGRHVAQPDRAGLPVDHRLRQGGHHLAHRRTWSHKSARTRRPRGCHLSSGGCGATGSVAHAGHRVIAAQARPVGRRPVGPVRATDEAGKCPGSGDQSSSE